MQLNHIVAFIIGYLVASFIINWHQDAWGIHVKYELDKKACVVICNIRDPDQNVNWLANREILTHQAQFGKRKPKRLNHYGEPFRQPFDL